ncbi:MAG: TonB-dependent receptor plug domain-containing protein [Alistipes sp.]|nr:TonB-dependent receptor plug domain-containing protein [Alistipes sp.]
MKRIFYFAGAISALLATENASAQNDSISMYEIQRVEVTATRAGEQTPIAYSDLTGDEIAERNYGQDVPYLLQMLPSVVATSEAGNGIGATSLRIRGTDATRINVTMNGVPMNDAETHSVYWYDTPDVVSSVGSIQLQRGAGTSTNGTGAFGGSLNMTTAALPTEFKGTASLSYGSFNTAKQAVGISSGLLGGHWALDARLSHISSDGYVDRAFSDMTSYMVQAGWYGGRTVVKALSFGGKARVGLSYTGLSKEQMAENRRYNPEGEIIGYLHDAAGNTLRDEEGVPMTGVVGFYNNHTDNYLQINNQLVVSHIFNDKWSLNATAHYTYGNGYYQNYKNDQKLAKYGLPAAAAGDITVTRSNLIRRKSMRNDFGGIVASANYRTKRIELSMGISANIYDGSHFGHVLAMEKVAEFDPTEYYRNYTTKYDANIFAKVNWEVASGLNLFADLQYRHIDHCISGVNDNFDDVTGALQRLDIARRYDFFNPKLGISYRRGAHNAYISASVAQKEPTRNNFTDIRAGEYPTSEKLLDGEAGYRYTGKVVEAGVNLYYMYYKDQLVLTGELSDTGELLSRNVPKSYRRGVELTLAVKPCKWFTFGANATLSQNRILDYTDYIDGVAFYRGTTTIAYSPAVVAGTMFDFHVAGFAAVLSTRYVSKQYLTNGEYEELTLDRYCVSDLNLSYTLHTKRIEAVRFGLALNNIFNTAYCNNGYGGLWLEGSTIEERGAWACYFPQAGFNVLANVTLNF